MIHDPHTFQNKSAQWWDSSWPIEVTFYFVSWINKWHFSLVHSIPIVCIHLLHQWPSPRDERVLLVLHGNLSDHEIILTFHCYRGHLWYVPEEFMQFGRGDVQGEFGITANYQRRSCPVRNHWTRAEILDRNIWGVQRPAHLAGVQTCTSPMEEIAMSSIKEKDSENQWHKVYFRSRSLPSKNSKLWNASKYKDILLNQLLNPIFCIHYYHTMVCNNCVWLRSPLSKAIMTS